MLYNSHLQFKVELWKKKIIVDFFKMLLKRYQNVHNPPEPMISPNMETVDDIIAPYTVESTGAQVTLTTAISLVNRFLLFNYCS